MTDDAAAPGPATRGGTLGLRLALAFLTVALAAVGLLAGLTAAFAAADVSTLASQQRAELANAIAVAAGAVWDRNKTWSSADLSPVLDLAAKTGEAVQVRDQTGQPRYCGPSPALPVWRPCSRCSPDSRWPGGSPARLPG